MWSLPQLFSSVITVGNSHRQYANECGYVQKKTLFIKTDMDHSLQTLHLRVLNPSFKSFKILPLEVKVLQPLK